MRYRLTQMVCALLLLSFLSTSISAEPRAIVVGVQEFSRSVRFGFLSNGWDGMLNTWSSSLLLFLPRTGNGKKSQETPAVSRIVLLPGDQQLRQGESINFSAIGYAADNSPVSGLTFSYTIKDIGRGLESRNLPNGTFSAQITGDFLVTAQSSSLTATSKVKVQPDNNYVLIKKIKELEDRGDQIAADKLKILGHFTSQSISSRSLPKQILDTSSK